MIGYVLLPDPFKSFAEARSFSSFKHLKIFLMNKSFGIHKNKNPMDDIIFKIM